MPRSVISIVLFLLVVFIGTAAAAPPKADTFTLKIGQSVDINGTGFVLGFADLGGDSRCPASVVCIWEGDAAVKLFADPVSGETVEFFLHTASMLPAEKSVGGYRIALTKVSPYPQEPGPINRQDYVITVKVNRLDITPVSERTWGKIKALFR